MKKAYFSILGRRDFLTSPGQSVQVLLKSIITLAILSLLTFGPQSTFAQNVPHRSRAAYWDGKTHSVNLLQVVSIFIHCPQGILLQRARC